MDYPKELYILEDLKTKMMIEQSNYSSAIDFIEFLEAITTDKNVANKIREFLVEKNIWKK